jgi:hypothetical protein
MQTNEQVDMIFHASDRYRLAAKCSGDAADIGEAFWPNRMCYERRAVLVENTP